MRERDGTSADAVSSRAGKEVGKKVRRAEGRGCDVRLHRVG